MTEVEQSLDLETTVPTDLTVSSYSDHAVRRSNYADTRNASKWYQDRKEIFRENQLLKMELAKKTAMINTLQKELNLKSKEFEEKIQDLANKKTFFHTRLNTELNLCRDEATCRIALLEKALDSAKQQTKQHEELIEKLRHSLDVFTFSDETYSALKSKPRDSMEVADYVMLKTCESVRHYAKQYEEVEARCLKLEERNSKLQAQLNEHLEGQQNTQQMNIVLKQKVIDLTAKLSHVESQVEHGNYAVENFTRVQAERDMLQERVFGLEKSQEHLRVELHQALQDKDSAYEEITTLKHKYDLLQHEWTTTNRQLGDALRKLGESHDEASKLKSELKLEKSSREDLMQRFVSLKDKLRLEYEERLLREVQRSQDSTSEQYEERLKNLKESNHLLSQQKESTENTVSKLREKYEELHIRFQDGLLNESQEIKRLEQELQNAKIEKQKAVASCNAAKQTYIEKCNEYEKALAKLQLTEEELSHLRSSTDKRLRELETELGMNKARLEIFEKMEAEVDDVVHEAAADATISDQGLEAIVDEMSLPKKARHTFIKCVHLTRKTLQLERLLDSEKEKVITEKQNNEKLSHQIRELNQLLDQVDQPYAFFLQRLREKETVIRDLASKLNHADAEMKALQQEKEVAVQKLNAVSEDFESVLKNRQEIAIMKEQLSSLKSMCDSGSSKRMEKQKNIKKKKGQPSWK